MLELDALLGKIQELAEECDRNRYFSDERYRWVIHRLWIAVGNETTRLEPPVVVAEPWNGLRKLRNELAHVRLPDIDEDKIWRLTAMRPPGLRQRLRDMRR